MYENEVREVESNYKKWLCHGNLNSENIIKYRVGEFIINLTIEQAYGIIKLGYKNNLKFEKVGESIVYEINNDEMKYDAALLILYIAERLDDANKNAPAFLRREERYFYNRAKDFISKISLI